MNTNNSDNSSRDAKPRAKAARSEFLDALWKGALIGTIALAIGYPAMRWYQMRHAAQVSEPVATAPVQSVPVVPAAPVAAPVEIKLADFQQFQPSGDARQMANWVVQSRDNAALSFVIVDKKDARVYVFDKNGHMKSNTPALMGKAIGDDSFPGIGEKPLAQVKPEEKTTPAGRFVAELGVNTTGEDVVWVDYDAAVSMHRVRPVVKSERRLERLASASSEDNRISFGCINLPPAFYEKVLRPTVEAGKTVIYVMPETRPLQATFASFREPVMVAGAVTQAAVTQ